jgi:hypothetical protein
VPPQIRFFLELLDIETSDFHPPVKVADVVTGDIFAVLCELDAVPLIRAAMHAADDSLDNQPRAHLQVADPRQDRWLKIRSIVGHAMSSGTLNAVDKRNS